jgi:hypothetical protein
LAVHGQLLAVRNFAVGNGESSAIFDPDHLSPLSIETLASNGYDFAVSRAEPCSFFVDSDKLRPLKLEGAVPALPWKFLRANAILVVLYAQAWSADATPGPSEFIVEPRDKPSSKALISQRVSIRVDSSLVVIPVLTAAKNT